MISSFRFLFPWSIDPSLMPYVCWLNRHVTVGCLLKSHWITIKSSLHQHRIQHPNFRPHLIFLAEKPMFKIHMLAGEIPWTSSLQVLAAGVQHQLCWDMSHAMRQAKVRGAQQWRWRLEDLAIFSGDSRKISMGISMGFHQENWDFLIGWRTEQGDFDGF